MSIFDTNKTMPQFDPEIEAQLATSQGMLRGYVLSLVGGDTHVANDVLQEANLVICKKSGDFEKGTNFIGWACRIAYFEVMRHRTNCRRDKLVFDDTVLEKLADEGRKECEHYASRKEALAHCLLKLSDSHRELVLKRYYEGESVDEIGLSRKQKPNSISQLLFRIRKSLLMCISSSMAGNQKI
tara:strand:+ start:252 stop:803 length:552 start_codon:yes stop_codon:yes gene_type:complete